MIPPVRANEISFRRLLDSSITGVVFWDIHGDLLGANDLFLNMVGYTREDLEQGRLSWKDITPPEYVAVDEKAIAELLATGSCTPFEKEYIRKDGRRISVLIGSAMLEGAKDQGSSFVMDITERKQVEEQLRQSEERFRQVAESITEVFWMTDPAKGEILYVSPAYEEIWGRTCASVYQNPTGWLEAIHPEDRQRVKETALTLQISGDYDEEYRVIRPDGSIRWIRDRAFPIRDTSGRVYRLTGIAEDITEAKRAEEKLKASTEQLRALSARLQTAKEEESTRIARELHDELGSALTSLKWSVELLEKDLLQTRGDVGATTHEVISHMAALIDSTIDSVRRISGELRPSLLYDLGLVAAVQSHLRQFQEHHGIVVHFENSAENVELTRQQSTAAFSILQEALTNILRHAHATNVHIQLRKQNGEVVLVIRDNGRGITDEEKSDQRTLGLLGMRERARLIGAEIEIAGAQGKGTVIKVRIPVAG